MDRQAYLKQARAKAAKYCSGRERSPREVLQKLAAWELSDEDAQGVLAELVDEQFVDEDRFCRAFCHDKFEFNRWGKMRIRQELMKHQLPDEVVTRGLDNIDPERYAETLRQLAEKKYGSLVDEPWVKKQKTAAFLVRKGYEMDLVMEVVRLVAAQE